MDGNRTGCDLAAMTGSEASLEICNLSALAVPRISALGNLQLTEPQEIFGGSFAESIVAWRDGPPDRVLGLAFLHRGAPVGMTLFKRPPLSPAWVPSSAASIHGLKIALPWQGRGWGHAAFRLAVRRLVLDWPQTTRLALAVDAGNAAALAVCRAFGMADSGPVFPGPNGREHRLEIPLESGPASREDGSSPRASGG